MQVSLKNILLMAISPLHEFWLRNTITSEQSPSRDPPFELGPLPPPYHPLLRSVPYPFICFQFIRNLPITTAPTETPYWNPLDYFFPSFPILFIILILEPSHTRWLTPSYSGSFTPSFIFPAAKECSGRVVRRGLQSVIRVVFCNQCPSFSSFSPFRWFSWFPVGSSLPGTHR